MAIAVPLSNRAELTPDEQISLNHLVRFLGQYDKYVVIPNSLRIHISSFDVKRFPEKFFGSVSAHTRLMLSSVFYDAFSMYKYILVYHPDALVFSDQLRQWCETDMDFIAPPWITRSPEGKPIGFSRCGNGGFSLRKVQSFLRVIRAKEQLVSGDKAWGILCARRPRWHRILLQPVKYWLRLKHIDRCQWVRFLFYRNEDRFWSDKAKLFYPNFQISPVDLSLRFAFDDEPRYCFEKNEHILPFGCHGWNKYDRAFWEPYLIRQ